MDERGLERFLEAQVGDYEKTLAMVGKDCSLFSQLVIILTECPADKGYTLLHDNQ